MYKRQQKNKTSIPVHEFTKDAEDIIERVEDKLVGVVPDAQRRFFAIKLLEKDDKIQDQMNTSVDAVSYTHLECSTAVRCRP